MAWTDEPTKKQLSAFKSMARNLDSRFTEEEIDVVISEMKTRKEASEALSEIRDIRTYECMPRSFRRMNVDPADFSEWYEKLVKAAEKRILNQGGK